MAGLILVSGMVDAAPEVDRDAYWIESTFCAVTLKLKVDTAGPDLARPLAGLVGAPAYCIGSLSSQPQPGGVLALLQRGFRITAAEHHVVPLAAVAAHVDAEPALLVTALFVLEKPAVKPSPPPK